MADPADKTTNPLQSTLSIQDPNGNPLSSDWADAASWHAQNLRDTWAAAQNPQTWVDAARQYGDAMLMGTTGPSAVRAFHATSEPFETYDWGRLGDYTSKNITDADNPDSWAMRLARLGPWAHEKPLAGRLFTGTDLPVELSGKGKAYPSLDKLHDAIAKAGGPEKLRALLTDRGFGHVRVKDEEFGGNSYVGLSPETFKIVPPEE